MRKITIEKLVEYVIAIIFFAQILYLFYINIFKTKYMVDFDSYSYFEQAKQIWGQKTLNLNDYYYTTHKMWDSPLFLVVILYGLTKDIFLSVGISNVVLIISLILVTLKLLNDLKLKRVFKYVVLLLMFTVYQFGITDYADEMFINAAWYGVRIVELIILLDLMICVHLNYIDFKFKFLLIIEMLLLFISGMSTGIFAACCFVLPIFLYEIALVVLSDEKMRRFSKEFIIPIMLMISSFAGKVTNSALGLTVLDFENKDLVVAEDLFSNFFNCIAGLFKLLGWPSEEIKLFSVSGIISCLSFVIGFIILCLIIKNIYIVVKGFTGKNNSSYIRGFIASITIVNIALFTLVRLNYTADLFEYRYWLIILIPSFILVGKELQELFENKLDKKMNLMVLVIIVSLSVICLYRDYLLIKKDNCADKYEAVMNEVAKENLDVLYVYGEYFSTRVMVTFSNPNQEVVALYENAITDDGRDWIYNTLRMQKWGEYVKYDGDCMEYAGKVGILCDGSQPKQQEFYEHHASIVKRINDYTLCILDENCVDCKYGIPSKYCEKSKDYLDHGYEFTNALFVQGNCLLEKKKAAMIEGAFEAETDGVYSIKLNYTSKDSKIDDSYLYVIVNKKDGTQEEYKVSLENNVDSVTIDNIEIKKEEKYLIKIVKNDNSEIQINSIEYEKNSGNIQLINNSDKGKWQYTSVE
ncbi:MAG: hypothetical protein K6B67_04725 [Lachnospiraceae bacterium]|nr:hypothetical protein [Lachnospiraceae bacterium]